MTISISIKNEFNESNNDLSRKEFVAIDENKLKEDYTKSLKTLHQLTTFQCYLSVQ